MRNLTILILFSVFLLTIGCSGSSETAQLETYPAVTPEEQKVIDENIESLRDEVR